MKPIFGSVILAGLAALLIGALAPAWIIMLALGAIHHDLTADCPALGFGMVYVGCLALGALISIFK